MALKNESHLLQKSDFHFRGLRGRLRLEDAPPRTKPPEGAVEQEFQNEVSKFGTARMVLILI